MAVPGLILLKLRNNEDVHVESGTEFLSLVECSHRFGAYDPCGTHSIWYCLFSLDLTSSEMAISEIFHVALRVGPMIPRLSEG